MKRLRVAITGAAGRVGSVLAKRLCAEHGFDVVAIVRNGFAARLLADAGTEVRIGSMTAPASSSELLRDCDAVVNCALAKGWPRTARQQNEAIVGNIARAPSVRVAVHFSSVAVYGPCVEPARNSFERPRPDSAYGLDKLRLERVTARLLERSRKRYHIVRLGHVYGPSQWVSREILERSADPSFSLPFGGQIASNAVSIEAVVAAVAAMLGDAQPSGIRNLVDSPQSTWRTLFDLHTDLLGRTAVGSMPDAASLRLRESYYAAARHPLGTWVRSTLAAVRALDAVGLAKLESFRRLVRGPLLHVPARFEAWANQAYVARKVRSALRHAGPAGLIPDVMCAPPIPGPSFAGIDPATAFAAMRDELDIWLRGLAQYRWDYRNLEHPGLASVARVA